MHRQAWQDLKVVQFVCSATHSYTLHKLVHLSFLKQLIYLTGTLPELLSCCA